MVHSRLRTHSRRGSSVGFTAFWRRKHRGKLIARPPSTNAPKKRQPANGKRSQKGADSGQPPGRRGQPRDPRGRGAPPTISNFAARDGPRMGCGSAGASHYRSYGRSLREAPAEQHLWPSAPFRVQSVFHPWLHSIHLWLDFASTHFTFAPVQLPEPGGFRNRWV